MQNASDAEYFKRRAEESRLAQANATDSSAEVVHGELMAAYDRLADEATADTLEAVPTSDAPFAGNASTKSTPSAEALGRWANEGGKPAS